VIPLRTCHPIHLLPVPPSSAALPHAGDGPGLVLITHDLEVAADRDLLIVSYGARSSFSREATSAADSPLDPAQLHTGRTALEEKHRRDHRQVDSFPRCALASSGTFLPFLPCLSFLSWARLLASRGEKAGTSSEEVKNK